MFINIVTLGAFAVICLIVFLVGETIGGGRRSRRFISDPGDSPDNPAANKIAPSAFATALARVIPQSPSEIENIERDLKRAGYYRPTAMVDYMSTRNGLLVGILIVTGAFAIAADPNTALPNMILAAGGVTACLGYGLPRLFLRWQANRRVARVQNGLPDALDMVRMCLTGGLPLRQALHRVSREVEFFHPDLSAEFAIIHHHADADTMSSALRQFARRVDAPDVSALAALVSQTDRMGTHVAEAIMEYADSVRRAWRQRAEERASKTSIKMLFPVILCLAPPVYVLLCGPPVIKLRNFLVEGHKPGGVLDSSIGAGVRPDNAGGARLGSSLGLEPAEQDNQVGQ